MKKILVLALVLASVWMVKLSYEWVVLKSALTELSNKVGLLQQQNASLNDNLIALKRGVAESGTQHVATPQSAIHAEAHGHSDDGELVRQQLDLIEFALQQEQYSMALEKLAELQRDTVDYLLAPAIADSLHNVLIKDQDMLKKFVDARVTQRNKINDLIHQIDREIQQELENQHSSAAPIATSFWQRMIQLESVKTPSAVLMQRAVVLKEAQLRLLIAQNALQQGQQIPFQQTLSAVAEILQQLPDTKSQQWIKQLYQIKATPLTPIPQLSTRTLMG